ncbi:MAG: methyltransferase [Pseudomonadota bacterium]
MIEHTRDAFYGGRLHVFQPSKGFRAGTDSLLLAAALPSEFKDEILELGCGAGGALLPAMHRVPHADFVGLERDPDMAALAQAGLDASVFGARGQIEIGDAANLPPQWQNRFGLVFSNPPFFEAGSIQQPGTGKEAAYLESISLKDWINAMLFALRPKGTLIMVHRAADLARMLTVLERQTGEITVLPVHSYPGSDAKRVLVRARKGLRPGALRLLSAKNLYEQKGGERTEWAKAMQQDGAGIDWN